jgi:hypothetical protein
MSCTSGSMSWRLRNVGSMTLRSTKRSKRRPSGNEMEEEHHRGPLGLGLGVGDPLVSVVRRLVRRYIAASREQFVDVRDAASSQQYVVLGSRLRGLRQRRQPAGVDPDQVATIEASGGMVVPPLARPCSPGPGIQMIPESERGSPATRAGHLGQKQIGRSV